MLFRRSAAVKYFLAALVGAILFCEWGVFRLQTVYWKPFECLNHDSSCTKILFIADPQIQGDNDFPLPLGHLFRWDSDRYLKSTFTIVMQHFKPDVLVYLGDLMDEGSIASMEQFHKYGKRILNIFETSNTSLKHVWLPGDNDIGGEHESIKKEKVAEFEILFNQPSVIVHRNITFYKVNGITHTVPNEIMGDTEKKLKIVVSHYPITNSPLFGKEVNNKLHPDIYFCAHEHESRYVKQNSDLSDRKKTWLNDETLTVQFKDDSLYEIYVPTCSYRMGTDKIGFGAAVIENNQHNMRYTVFWSPTRFPILFFYLGVLSLIVVYTIVFCIARLMLRLKKKPSYDKLSLIVERS